MPKVTIAHQPELTKEQTMEIFAAAFGDRYRVAPFRGLFRDYFGADRSFATYEALETHVREISAPFGPLTDAQWEHVTRTNARQRPDGTWAVGYDPRIAIPFRENPAPANLWPLWDAIRCPTLVLRGAQSDLLSAATAHAMSERGPRPRVVEFAGVGHAPMLLARDQVDVVVGFLRSTV